MSHDKSSNVSSSELMTSLLPPSLSHTQTHKTPQKAWVQFLVFIESSISLSDESRFFRFLSMTDPLKSLCMTTERRIQLMSGEGGGRGQDDTIHTAESMSGSRVRHGKYGLSARTTLDR